MGYHELPTSPWEEIQPCSFVLIMPRPKKKPLSRHEDGIQKKMLKEMKSFASDRKIFILMGLVYDGSLLSKLRMPSFVFFLYTAPFHHMLPVFVDESTSEQNLMSWSISMLYVFLCPVWPFMVSKSSQIFKLWDTVRSGFFQYTEGFTEKERSILLETNRLVIKSTRVSIIAYFCAGFGTYLKEMFSPESMRNYKPPYPGWFPWTINSNFRFAMALLYQLCLCLNTTFALESVFLMFAYHTIHYEGQFRLLKCHFEDTFPPEVPMSLNYQKDHRQRTLRRLKECVRHHLIITGLYKDILSYFGLCLLVYRVIVTIMVCILCYLTTTGITLNKFLQLFCFSLAILYLCFIFCIKGEQVAQMSNVWRETIYEVDWWKQPVEVQKTVQMMLIGASKPLAVYGVWKPIKYSHEGICVIAQETFSFFNMLRAMK